MAAAGDAEEVSTFVINSVVYASTSVGEWEPLGGGQWTEMHIFKDNLTPPNHRVVAWVTETNEVVLNANILAVTTVSLKSDDFAELVVPDEGVWGMYFPTAADAKNTLDAIEKIVAVLNGEAAPAPPAASAPEVAPPAPPAAEEPPAEEPELAKKKSEKRMSLANIGAVQNVLSSFESNMPDVAEDEDELDQCFQKATQRGSLSALDVAKPLENPSLESPGVTDLKHQVHVSYNEKLVRYEGLPEGWEHMNQQFGVSLDDVPKSDVAGYGCKIPAILVKMREYLEAHGGRDQVGIFRLAPDKDDCDAIKTAINRGDFGNGEAVRDVNIVANLIKVWFRDLPRGLYNSIPDSKLHQVADMTGSQLDQVTREYNKFEEPTKGLFLWLLDTMANVVMNESVNKMSAKNMSIVMSPNLYQVNAENPMAALTMAQTIADFTTKCLAARLKEQFNYEVTGI